LAGGRAAEIVALRALGLITVAAIAQIEDAELEEIGVGGAVSWGAASARRPASARLPILRKAHVAVSATVVEVGGLCPGPLTGWPLEEFPDRQIERPGPLHQLARNSNGYLGMPLPPKFNPCIHTALVRVVKLGVVKGGCDNLLFGVHLHIRRSS
jgi:hypothetical protein